MALRQRIGLMVPSVNTVLEPDFYRVVPPSVTVHSHRLWAPPRQWAAPGSAEEETEGPERFRRMNEDVDVAVRYLMTAPVDVLVYGCTSGSFLWGYGGENALLRRIEELSGRPGVVTTGAVLSAMRAFGARKITVLTPYPAATNRKLQHFMTESGEIEVLSLKADPKASTGSHAITAEDPEDILRFASRSCAPGSELVLCSCTAWRSFEIAGELERRLGIPVVTSNQATIWATLSRLGAAAEVTGHGALFTRELGEERVAAGA
jgi:maleate isomerase